MQFNDLAAVQILGRLELRFSAGLGRSLGDEGDYVAHFALKRDPWLDVFQCVDLQLLIL